MEKIFQGKTAIVTGGSFGIGRAAALAFSVRGANVVIADCVEDHETFNMISSLGGKAVFVKCDVSREEDVKRMIDQTMSTYDDLDYAFNNAGIEGVSSVTHECTSETRDKTIEVNLKGIWLCMKYEIPMMLRRGKGAIVNTASIAVLVGFPGLPAYVASKHAVVGLTKTAALEYAKQ